MCKVFNLVGSMLRSWFDGGAHVATANPSRLGGVPQLVLCQETPPPQQKHTLRPVAREPRANRPKCNQPKPRLETSALAELAMLEDHPERRVTHAEAIRSEVLSMIYEIADSLLDEWSVEQRRNVFENPKYFKFVEQLADDLIQPESTIHEIIRDARLERRIRSKIRKRIERLAWYRIK